MKDKQEQERQIKRFIDSGEVEEEVRDWDELLDTIDGLFCRNDTWEYFPDGIMFEDENGEYHVILIDAIIRKVLPDTLEIDPSDDAKLDLPTGKGVVIKTFLMNGDLDVEGITEADKLLFKANEHLLCNNAQDDIGNIIFENADGDYYVVTVEAVLSTPSDEWVESEKKIRDAS